MISYAERVNQMPKISGKKKIENSGDLSLGGERNFSLSVGEVLGKKPPDGGVTAKKNEKSEPGRKDAAKSESIRETVLRRESAGRGGKTVTVVDVRPALDADALSDFAKSMRKDLGCGSRVEGGRIILQGDIGDRAEVWLKKRGVKKIVRGN